MKIKYTQLIMANLILISEIKFTYRGFTLTNQPELAINAAIKK